MIKFHSKFNVIYLDFALYKDNHNILHQLYSDLMKYLIEAKDQSTEFEILSFFMKDTKNSFLSNLDEILNGLHAIVILDNIDCISDEIIKL